METADLGKTIEAISLFLSKEGFATERRNQEGKIEKIITPFDTALITFELYTCTQNRACLERVVSYLVEKAQQKEGKVQWAYNAPRSQSGLPPFPPDADGTALALLVLYSAAKAGINVDKKYLSRRNADQFEELLHQEGIKTWFGDFRPDEEPDIAVTSAVALYFSHVAPEHAVYEHLYNCLNRKMQNVDEVPKKTEYYLSGKYYALMRIAEIAKQDPNFLQASAQDAINKYLETANLGNALDAAFVGRAAALCGVREKAAEAKEFLVEQRQSNGLWPFVPLHNQKTYWVYGHEAVTAVFAINAIQEIKKSL